MVSKDTQYTVMMEALKWFRATLRLEILRAHERGLFEAVATMRQEMDNSTALRKFPPPPPLPDIASYSNKGTLRDMPAVRPPQGSYSNYDECVTIPVSGDDYEKMVVESLNKEDPCE